MNSRKFFRFSGLHFLIGAKNESRTTYAIADD